MTARLLTLAVQVVPRLDRIDALRQVGGDLDFLSAQDKMTATPAAFVVETGETTTKQPTTAQTRHTMALNFSVVLMMAAADVRGARKLVAAADLRYEIRAVLIGWYPDGFLSAVTYEGFGLKQLHAGFAGYELKFRTSYRD